MSFHCPILTKSHRSHGKSNFLLSGHCAASSQWETQEIVVAVGSACHIHWFSRHIYMGTLQRPTSREISPIFLFGIFFFFPTIVQIPFQAPNLYPMHMFSPFRRYLTEFGLSNNSNFGPTDPLPLHADS
jgi:hypothetical protein